MNQKILNKLAENALEYSLRNIDTNKANMGFCEAEAFVAAFDPIRPTFC